MGIRSSYNVGACRIIPAVPTNTASVKIHKNKRSRTIATYFQSSFTFTESSSIRVCSAINRTQKHERWSSVGQWRCEYPGFLIIGLLIRSGCVTGGGSTSNVDIDIVTSSDSIEIGPWIWQLPPKGPVVKLVKTFDWEWKEKVQGNAN